ncbi:uncharacterized protein LOC143019472 isoform X2 [Oratosquilla oratoria]|uniref:uncharacterized protein LOC143019472 isoform X2 n=1 Tax=Oratosquilla oratoria TaxID=337810 RepID=UPI003F76D3BC
MARLILQYLFIFHITSSISLASHLPSLEDKRKSSSNQVFERNVNESVFVIENVPGKENSTHTDEASAHRRQQATSKLNAPSLASNEREDKVLIIVNDSQCKASGEVGTCHPLFKCDLMGGQVKGLCEWGFGQCCVYKGTCGKSFSASFSYFSSGGEYNSPSSTCTFAVSPPLGKGGVCQLRLKVKQLQLTGPNEEGECAEDYFRVEGAVMPNLCQINNEQEVYVDVSALRPPFRLQVVTGASTAARRWNVEVEQIPCGSNRLAPKGCLIYSKATSGSIRSFNYDVTASTAVQPTVNKPGTRHSPASYMVCVKRSSGSCGIRWRSAGEEGAFSISGDFVSKLNPSVSRGSECVTDFLYFGTATMTLAGQTEQTDRICGYTFPDTLDTPSYSFLVVSNAVEGVDADFDNRGFHLNYEQLPC